MALQVTKQKAHEYMVISIFFVKPIGDNPVSKAYMVAIYFLLPYKSDSINRIPTIKTSMVGIIEKILNWGTPTPNINDQIFMHTKYNGGRISYLAM